jgi:hypothetical protein
MRRGGETRRLKREEKYEEGLGKEGMNEVE